MGVGAWTRGGAVVDDRHDLHVDGPVMMGETSIKRVETPGGPRMMPVRKEWTIPYREWEHRCKVCFPGLVEVR